MENQLEILGYITKNFNISIDAINSFSMLKNLIPDLDKETRDEILSAVKMQDAMFGIEKQLYEIGSMESDKNQIDEAMMLCHMITYSIGKISSELDMDIIDSFMYLSMHVDQIMHPYKKINPELPNKIVVTPTKNIIKNDNMSKATLKKIMIYSSEILNMMNSEVDYYIENKILSAGHCIDDIYTYYKFGDCPNLVEATDSIVNETPYSYYAYTIPINHPEKGFGVATLTSINKNTYDVFFANGIIREVPALDLVNWKK
jgi:hypothetical protein